MEVWNLLRPSLRRLTVLTVAAVVAAACAVLVEHARAAQYEGRVSVYFAQALGLDTTSNSVDPTADQLTSVFQLPSVEAKAAAAGAVSLDVVKGAMLSHATGSPIIEITAKGSQQEATKAAPALAAAGLEYFAEQGVARAKSVQASATAALATINQELGDYTARAGVPDVDAAVAAAAAAAASAPSGSAAAKAAAVDLARLRALQPQYDLLTTEVAGARSSVSQAYSDVGAAQGVAKAVQLPGNVVTAPVTPASRVTTYLRAAVGAVVVVVVLGVAYVAVEELRRRRAAAPASATGTVVPPPAAPPVASPSPAAGSPVPPVAVPDLPPVLPGDFPVLAPPAADAPVPPRTGPPPTAPIVPSAPPAAAADRVPPPPEVEPVPPDRYLAQARRFVRDQQRSAGVAREAQDQELQRRVLRDALQRVEREQAAAAPVAPEPPVAPAPPPAAAEDDEVIAAVHPLFPERARPQIRVLKVVPDPVEDDLGDEANSGC